MISIYLPHILNNYNYLLLMPFHRLIPFILCWTMTLLWLLFLRWMCDDYLILRFFFFLGHTSGLLFMYSSFVVDEHNVLHYSTFNLRFIICTHEQVYLLWLHRKGLILISSLHILLYFLLIRQNLFFLRWYTIWINKTTMNETRITGNR